MNDVPLVKTNGINDINTSVLALKRRLMQLEREIKNISSFDDVLLRSDLVDTVEEGVEEPVTSNAVYNALEQNSGDNTPLGTVTSYEGTTDPTDGQWFLTDGRDTTGSSIELSTYYPGLYTFLGGSNVLPKIFDHSFPSAWETITLPTSSTNAITMQYDGQLWLIDNTSRTSIYVNGVEEVWQTPANHTAQMFITFQKGDVIYANKTTVKTRVQYYKRYKIIKAVASTDTYTPPSSEIEQIESYFDNGINTIKNNALSYSTEEVATGGVWIDGKPIYKKTFSASGISSQSITLSTELNKTTITPIKVYGFGVNSANGDVLCVGYGNGANVYLNNTILGFAGGYTFSAYNITIEYTKTTDQDL